MPWATDRWLHKRYQRISWATLQFNRVGYRTLPTSGIRRGRQGKNPKATVPMGYLKWVRFGIQPYRFDEWSATAFSRSVPSNTLSYPWARCVKRSEGADCERVGARRNRAFQDDLSAGPLGKDRWMGRCGVFDCAPLTATTPFSVLCLCPFFFISLGQGNKEKGT